MSNAVLIALVISLLLGGGLFFILRSSKRAPAAFEATAVIEPPAEPEPAAPLADHATQMLQATRQQYYSTAFSAAELTGDIPETHQSVLDAVSLTLTGIADRERTLPRRPLLLPQLLRALNDPQTTREDLSAIILQDPVLAADVLRTANSPFYRVAREPVDSLDRAILLLGFEGLKSVVAASIMQPVFRTPKGQFDAFAPTLWELAMRTATAAGIYAARTGTADPTTAQLLGLLSALGPLAVFRATSEAYREQPRLVPRAEVYVRLIEACADATSSAIASHWELPGTFVLALYESRGTGHLENLTPLGKALEAGRSCALLSLAPPGNQRSILANKAAMAMGVGTTVFDAIWSALNAATGNAN
ncbi:MAG: HDOD domain-containing protein [Steroidobacteraceae bacterium]